MFKIAFCVLLVTVPANGEGNLCDCSCEGTKQAQGLPLCDKLTGKCKCRPGFSGERCETCIQFIPSTRSCKTCDCPSINNDCNDTELFQSFLEILEEETDVDLNFANEPTINKMQIDNIKAKLEGLINDINKKEKPNLLLLENFQKEKDNIEKDIRELLKKYDNDDLLKEDEDMLKDVLKTIEDILNTIENVENQNNIGKIAKNADNIMQNVTHIMNDDAKCLDVIDQFCSGKNASQLLQDILKELEEINLDKYFTRIGDNQKDIEEMIKTGKLNEEELNAIQIKSIPSLNETTYRNNHDKLERMNRQINELDNIHNQTNKLYDETKREQEESNLVKAHAFNTILIAPSAEIQEIIDNITSTIVNSNNLINDLRANKTKSEKEERKMELELKDMEEELEKFEDRRDKLESDVGLFVEMILKMKETVLNLTAEYKKKREEYQQFERELEESYEKIKTVLEEDTKCMKETANETEEKINASNDILDDLERDLNNVAVLLEEVGDVKEQAKVVKVLRDNLYEQEETHNLCPKHSLS